MTALPRGGRQPFFARNHLLGRRSTNTGTIRGKSHHCVTTCTAQTSREAHNHVGAMRHFPFPPFHIDKGKFFCVPRNLFQPFPVNQGTPSVTSTSSNSFWAGRRVLIFRIWDKQRAINSRNLRFGGVWGLISIQQPSESGRQSVKFQLKIKEVLSY